MTEFKASAGDYVRIGLAKKEIEGRVLESSDKSIVLLKLNSGYNIGISKENIQGYKVIRKFKSEEKEFKIPTGNGKKKIGLVVTGGTIASKLDPRTGGVNSLTDVTEFAKFYPKLFEKYDVKVNALKMKDSSDMDATNWKKIAEAVGKFVKDNEIEGVVVTHGTDSLAYSAAALSFMLRDLSKPVVLTYSQRSIDRASSDAELNLQCAARIACEDLAEVVVVGHAGMDDDYCLVIRGTKARKLHSTRRDAFKSVNSRVIAKVWEDKVEFIMERRPRNKEKLELDDSFSDKIALVKFYPGMKADVLDSYKAKGFIVEGLGLGHVSREWLSKLSKMVKAGIFVGMTTQTIYGRVDGKVYSIGRELEKVGVVFLKDLLSETAYVKLGWILGHRAWRSVEKVKEKMLENFAGEFNELLTK